MRRYRLSLRSLTAILALSLAHAQTEPTLKQYFQNLAQNQSGGADSEKDVARVGSQVADGSPEQISDALPWIIATLSHQEAAIRRIGAVTLIVVSQRMDSPVLFSKYQGSIPNLLNLSDPIAQWAAVMLIGNIVSRQPNPNLTLMSTLPRFISQADRDTKAQIGALFYLVRYDPENTKAAEAVQSLWSRPLDKSARMDLLARLGDARVKNPEIIDFIAHVLEGQDQSLQLIAVDSLSRIGREAVIRTQPFLRRAAEQSRSNEVKSAAKKALLDAGVPAQLQ